MRTVFHGPSCALLPCTIRNDYVQLIGVVFVNQTRIGMVRETIPRRDGKLFAGRFILIELRGAPRLSISGSQITTGEGARTIAFIKAHPRTFLQNSSIAFGG